MANIPADMRKKLQRRILDALCENEKLLAVLYGIYADKCPDCHEFWQQISQEETKHAALLTSLGSALETGDLFAFPERVDIATAESITARLRGIIADTRQRDITESVALTTAMTFESSVIEGRFFASAESDSPGYKTVAKLLLAHTEQHKASIAKRWQALQLRRAASTPRPPAPK